MLFPYLLKHIVRDGALCLLTADGRRHTIGTEKPSVVVKLHRKRLEWTLGMAPDLKIGEAYMDGTLTIEAGTLGEFVRILLVNYRSARNSGDLPLLRWLDRISGRSATVRQFNPVERARENVAHHYDLPDELYDYFLDEDRQYSCAYFTDPHNSLDQAQLDKKHHLASKLLLTRPDMKVLDIGSGWGGLGLYLAQMANCNVTGITLSKRQHAISNARARKAGLAHSCRYELQDYRQEARKYDRIVSVGMFEHVGKKNYDEFFAQVHRLLADDGVCLLHSIGSYAPPRSPNPFIRKYIFPGGDTPSLSEVMEAVQRAGLYVTDIEILRLHYAETLKRWYERFRKRRDDVVAQYGERFYRMWEIYLVGCEAAFRYDELMVMQIQLSKRLETVPIQRDYMFRAERHYRKKTNSPASAELLEVLERAL